MRIIFFIASIIIATSWNVASYAQNAPWGTTTAQIAGYAPQNVVYDVRAATPQELSLLLDRLRGLKIEYGLDPFDASIIVVLHGPEMQFFDTRTFTEHEDLVRQAQSLAADGMIEFRMCQWSANKLGIQPEHVHGFVQMIPLGDAEIIRLQQEENYAYMK